MAITGAFHSPIHFVKNDHVRVFENRGLLQNQFSLFASFRKFGVINQPFKRSRIGKGEFDRVKFQPALDVPFDDAQKSAELFRFRQIRAHTARRRAVINKRRGQQGSKFFGERRRQIFPFVKLDEFVIIENFRRGLRRRLIRKNKKRRMPRSITVLSKSRRIESVDFCL